MLIDARELQPGRRVGAEVCVIGTGPAGAVVAAELAARGLDVVVLEGGGERYAERQAETYRAAPAERDDPPHDPLDAVRQKRLGGTSAVWGGRCAPLDDLDLKEWPLDPASLGPHLHRAQRHLHAGEYTYSAAASGLPSAPAGVRGSGVLDVDATWRWSPPTAFGAGVRSLAGLPNVWLMVEATVVRLERDTLGGAVTAAIVSPRPGVEVRVEAATFVLAAGGLESARVLLASDRETPAGLGNEHDQVGRHYMTHPVGEVGSLVPSATGRALGLGYARTRDGVYARRMFALSPQTRDRHGLPNLKAAVWFADPMDPTHGDGLLSTFSLTYWALSRARLGFKSAGTHARYARTDGVLRHVGNVARDWRRVAAFTASWAAPRLTGGRVVPSFMPLDGGTCRLRFDAEQSADPANRVTLSRERDALGQRRLRVRHRVSAADRDGIRRSAELIGAEFTRLGLGSSDMSDAVRVTDPADMALADGTHQMGLLRMGHTPRTGVVDGECRVHGAENLYVAGSAVFPTAGAVGPTLMIVALAARIAARIAADRGVTGPVG